MRGTDIPRTTKESARALLEAVCQGDVQAFETLCVQLEPPLYNYLLRLVKDHSEAEDLAQETLLRLYRMVRNGRLHLGKGSPRVLAFAIAHNLAVDFHRRVRNATPTGVSTAASPSARVERTLLREQMEKALADLPKSHRSALMLREFGGLSYAEIADTLDAAQGAVKTWIYRARRRLATLLDRDGQYVGEGNDDV